MRNSLIAKAALASAATGRPPPPSSAFVGEVGLTGHIRPVPGMPQRLAAARARGIATVFAPVGTQEEAGVAQVRHILDALEWVPSTRR